MLQRNIAPPEDMNFRPDFHLLIRQWSHATCAWLCLAARKTVIKQWIEILSAAFFGRRIDTGPQNFDSATLRSRKSRKTAILLEWRSSSG